MNFFRIIFVTFLFIIVGFTTFPPLDKLLSILENLEEKYTPEKTYIHTDKPFYTSGETIWLKSYLVNGITHKKTNKSNVLHIELINPKDSIVFKQKIFVDPNDFGAPANISVSKKWSSGKYQLRAYTNYMLEENNGFYFRKNIQIEKTETITQKSAFVDLSKFPELKPIKKEFKKISSLNEIKLNFYPEGGTFLSGRLNKLGIKSTDLENNGIQIQGAIKEKGKNTIVTMFRTFDFGLGQTSFIPKKGIKYVAEILINNQTKAFDLPVANEKIEHLSITNNSDNLLLNIITGYENLIGYSIIGHVRGHVFFIEQITTKNKEIDLKLITSKFPSGISHFTLFDPSGNPRCERLVFIDHTDSDVKSKILLSKKQYKKRERIGYNVTIEGNHVANVSLAVTQKSIVPLNTNETIKSWLLLNSDLRGEIPNAAEFFNPNKTKKQRDFLLESLMLTHGWRRFNWNDIYKNSYLRKDIVPEKGITISGYAIHKEPQYRKEKIETLILFTKKNTFTDTQFLDSKNRFSYGPFNLKDSVKTIVKAEAIRLKKKEQNNISIILDREKESPVILPIPASKLQEENTYFENYKKNQAFIDVVNFSFNGANQLNGVLIRGKKRTPRQEYDELSSSLGLYNSPTNRIILDDLIGSSSQSILDLMSGLPSVNVIGAPPNQKVTIRNFNLSGQTDNPNGINNPNLNNNPLFLLDGNRVDIGFIQNIKGSEVCFIDVLKGNDSATFGSQGANGVIAIYLKKNRAVDVVSKAPGIVNFITLPFYKAKEFFSPDYFNESLDLTPDYRTTLFWEPNLTINNSKLKTDYFYTGDKTGKFQIEVQGITNSGNLIYLVEEFEIIE